MPYLSEIVTLINQSLANNKLKDGSRFIKDLNGISELVIRNTGEQTTVPTLVNTFDWREYTGIDDRFSVQIYHRVVSVEQVESPISFGDGDTTGREQVRMVCVCFADRKRTKLTPYELGFIIRSSLNQQFTGSTIASYTGLLGATVEATADNYNSLEVWQNEYALPAESYPIQLHQMLFSIEYTITTDYNNSCITSCLEC